MQPAHCPHGFPHMAYFRKLASGKWRAEVELAGVRETRGGFLTKREAAEWAGQQEADIRAGKAGKWPRRTLADAITRYRDEITPTKASAKAETLRLDAILRDHPALCGKLLVEVTPDDLGAWVAQRLQTVKGSSVKRESNTFSNVWTVAAKVWRWCPVESPWTFVKMPSEGPPRDRRVNWREIRKVCRRLGYVTGQPPITLSQEVAYAWLLALRTAMRSGELLGLTVEAVNLQTRVARLDVHKTVRYTGRARFVPFTRHAARLFAVMVKGKKGELFRVSDQSRDVLFRKATKACGIVGMRFHDSRAEALTLLSRRVDLLTLQKISGHTDINQLSSAYYRETPEQVAARL